MKYFVYIAMVFVAFQFELFAQNPFVWSTEGGDEISRQLAFVASEVPPNNYSIGQWHEQKDRMLVRLTRSDPPIPNLAEKLMEIARRNSCDHVTRNYIIQYLQIDLADKVSRSEQAAIQLFIEDMMRRTEDTTAATAILVSRLNPYTTKDEVVQNALAIVQDENALPINKAVALKVISESSPDLAKEQAATLAVQELSSLTRAVIDTISDSSAQKMNSSCFGCEQ